MKALRYPKFDQMLQEAIRLFLYIFAVAMPFSIATTQISVTLAILSWLARLLVTRGARIRKVQLEWPLIIFIVAMAVALPTSGNVSQSIVFFFKRILLLPIVYLLANNVADKAFFRRLVLLFIAAIALYSLWGIVGYFSNPTVRVRHIQNSMTTGGITMIGALAAFAGAAFATKKNLRLMALIAGMLNTVCLVLTSTRGSWLGFFAGVLLLLFYYNKKWLIALPLLAIAFGILGPQNFAHRVRHFFDPTWGTNAKRLAWWQTGMEIFKDHPVVGVGDMSMQKIYQKYAPPGTTELIGHFHSNYVHIAVATGIIGLTAFLGLMVSVFIKLLRTARSRPLEPIFRLWAVVSAAIFVAFNINGFFEWNFGDAEIITMVWFVVGLTCAIPLISQD